MHFSQMDRKEHMIRGTVPFYDIAQYSSAFAGVWDLEFLQLTAGSESEGCRYVTDGKALLYEELYPASIGLRGTLAGDTIAFVLTNQSGQSGRWQGGSCPSNALAYATRTTEVDVLLPQGTGNIAAVLPLARFRDDFERLSGLRLEVALPPGSLFRVLGREACEWLRGTWWRLLRSANGAEPLQKLIVESLVRVCGDPSDRSCAPFSRSRLIFRKAMEFCRNEHSQKNPVDLALDLGVSLRTLEMAFRSCMELPPSRYLRRLRLNRAHAGLVRHGPEETTVTRIATDLGFTELGRFSVEYRRIFGETPSATLRRGQRGVGAELPEIH